MRHILGMTACLLSVCWLARAEEAQMSRVQLWKQIAAAESQGLPQTAIKYIDPLIQSALADKAYGEAAHAIARKIVLEGN
ncbi:MAG: hypothetical protein IT577_21280, partial [Verrucomicrobiae bacterium]|nr:hypothetical protein [Verrucomicrobiae bacterium]